MRLTDDQGKQYNLLSAEGAQPSTDIVTVTGHRLSQFLTSNLLAPLDTGRLKNWDKLAFRLQGRAAAYHRRQDLRPAAARRLRGPGAQHRIHQGRR
ncbi:MAG: hypothetical protein QM711_12795 [Micropruina sp.]|uniref:hypothetical protein n=1 Tax=Micropruina sp. TaxID=2737536 RepID=UPI0039E4467F